MAADLLEQDGGHKVRSTYDTCVRLDNNKLILTRVIPRLHMSERTS